MRGSPAAQVNRMEAWVVEHGYRESGARPCVHGLLHGACHHQSSVDRGLPDCWSRPDFLDHVRLWRTRDGRRFLLAHSYHARRVVEGQATTFAARHGLRWAVLSDDDWYGFGTTPIRLWLDPCDRRPERVRIDRRIGVEAPGSGETESELRASRGD